jgi:hypothetical protein
LNVNLYVDYRNRAAGTARRALSGAVCDRADAAAVYTVKHMLAL